VNRPGPKRINRGDEKMKKINILILLAAIAFAGCKQNYVVQPVPSVNINVVNAVNGGDVLNLGNSELSVFPYNYTQLPMLSGNQTIKIATGDTPPVVYYDQTQNLETYAGYSLFLCGDSPANVESVFVKDNLAVFKDSVCAVRFINLMPGSDPISVNISGNANGSEVQSLAYKNLSNFIQHPAKKVNKSYSFDIRDAATGNLLTSYQLTTPFFNEVTIAIAGTTSGPVIILDNNYK